MQKHISSSQKVQVESKLSFIKRESIIALKDLSVIVICIAIVYVALNNTYVRPHLTTVKGAWSINKREHKLLLGLSGHTYLELIDDNGKVRGQIHGFAYNESTGEIVERAMQSGYKLKAFAFDYNYYAKEKSIQNSIHNNKSNAVNTINNKAWDDFNKNINDLDTDLPGTRLLADSSTTINSIWNKAKLCAAAIDSQNIDYPRYGFKIISETENSNSVAHSIIECSGLNDVNIGLFTPGQGTELLK